MKQIFIYTLQSTRDLTNIRYVGKTSQKLKTRFNQHMYAARKGAQRHVCNWIRKELREGYSIIIQELDFVEALCDADWQILEKYWISQCKVWGFKLTNETEGGEGSDDAECIRKRNEKLLGKHRSEETKKKISISNQKPKTEEHKAAVKKSMIEKFGIKIKQYSLDGKLIKIWDSISLIEETLNIDASNIGKCAAKEEHFNSAGGFIWRYENEDYIPDTSHYIVHLNKNYDKLGEFHSFDEASLSVFGTNESNIKEGIGGCCHGRNQQFREHIFLFKKDYESGNFIKYTFKPKVAQYTLNGDLIKVYKSANEIEKELGFGKRQVRECCKGIRESHKGFIFKFI